MSYIVTDPSPSFICNNYQRASNARQYKLRVIAQIVDCVYDNLSHYNNVNNNNDNQKSLIETGFQNLESFFIKIGSIPTFSSHIANNNDNYLVFKINSDLVENLLTGDLHSTSESELFQIGSIIELIMLYNGDINDLNLIEISNLNGDYRLLNNLKNAEILKTMSSKLSSLN
ncbi:uncharacterized protein ASCRUDRAFT_157249 [Ascoidea rubescens DSM 1968]|uniref:Uncharacterized protein n=1 Tax=Ascoidea rubescens DSM 1968 TaxID=1344418 RepID=A0A1D2VEV0_9ASCO|nr:hypothetical protein ASCRUDRAFT_157249 [Ascoidea rubescens DSM 1968]ODV60181.1 hypothetical protein ASCRUDRAFT_157249 [Ascoidea rubescens DSM 1968]